MNALLTMVAGKGPVDAQELGELDGSLSTLERRGFDLGQATGLLVEWRKTKISLGGGAGNLMLRIKGLNLSPKIEGLLTRAADRGIHYQSNGEMGYFRDALRLQTELGWGGITVAAGIIAAPISIGVGAVTGVAELGVLMIGGGAGNVVIGNVVSLVKDHHFQGASDIYWGFGQGMLLAPILGVAGKGLEKAQIIPGLASRVAGWCTRKGIYDAQAMKAGVFAAKLGWGGKFALAGTGVLGAGEQVVVFELLNGPGKLILNPLMTGLAAELNSQTGNYLTPMQEEEAGSMLATGVAFVSPLKGVHIGAEKAESVNHEKGFKARVKISGEGLSLRSKWGKMWNSIITDGKDFGLNIVDSVGSQIGLGGLKREIVTREAAAQHKAWQEHNKLEREMNIDKIPGAHVKWGAPGEKQAVLLLTARGTKEMLAGGKLETALKRLAREGYTVKVGSLDRAAHRMLMENPTLMNAMGEKSLLDFSNKARGERRVARRTPVAWSNHSV
jgi:hypothetical protein